jgi:hypothetical protein
LRAQFSSLNYDIEFHLRREARVAERRASGQIELTRRKALKAVWSEATEAVGDWIGREARVAGRRASGQIELTRRKALKAVWSEATE